MRRFKNILKKIFLYFNNIPDSSSRKTNSLLKNIQGISNNLTLIGKPKFQNCKINIVGNYNIINIEDLALLKDLTVYIRGNYNKISISKNVKFTRGGDIWIEDDFCEFSIGENSTVENAHFAITEHKSKLIIGEDCMLSTGIEIRTGDSHSIIDKRTQKRINFAQSIEIEEHVWIGSQVSILKGAKIAKNSVVATRAVVTKKFEEENCLIGGFPAKILRNDIEWDRKRIYERQGNKD